MSAFADELKHDVVSIVEKAWSTREGQVIPETPDLGLGNHRVVLDAVFFYADLADSTELAVKNKEQASEVYKAYLKGVTKLIKKNGGEVRSFDGDRVMGVFIEGTKNTSAVTCGLQVNWFFKNALVPKFQSFYAALASFPFAQTVGIDVGQVHVARGGVRVDNDLIWVGRAPNVAAKLSSIRDGLISTVITDDVYNAMMDSAKLGGNPLQNMWTEYDWEPGKPYGAAKVYGSTWWWEP
jgi:class 3 adenylate cyclase